jgi:hypothetical protein
MQDLTGENAAASYRGNSTRCSTSGFFSMNPPHMDLRVMPQFFWSLSGLRRIYKRLDQHHQLFLANQPCFSSVSDGAVSISALCRQCRQCQCCRDSVVPVVRNLLNNQSMVSKTPQMPYEWCHALLI